MELIPMGPGFGVEVRGVDLIDVASNGDAYDAVRAAFEEHSVLLFRNQRISDDVQVAYSRAFGPLELSKVGSLGHGSFYGVLRNFDAEGRIVPDDHKEALRARANQLWHTDSSFKRAPALASVLSARTIPDRGGETQFASTRLAWERLPPARQAQLKDLVVWHSYATSRDQISPRLMSQAERDALPPVDWRMTWRNPVNGRTALYIASHAGAIEGMGDNEAKALLGELIEDATRAEYTYLHTWQPGDVVMWDNRATMHRGRPWPGDQIRHMVRTTISATDRDGVPHVLPMAA